MRLLLIILSTILLVGCNPNVIYKDNYIYVTKYRTIEGEYLTYCPLVEPPREDRYSKANLNQRVDMWIKVYLNQMEATGLRNQKMDELIEINNYLSEQYSEDSLKDTSL